MMKKEPDRLYIDKKDRRLYDELKEKEDMFKGMKNKELFILAMIIGFDHGAKNELNTKDGYFLAKDLDENDWALFNAIAIWEHDTVNVLKETGDVYSVAEEYAHYGIKILHHWVVNTPYGSFPKEFESALLEKFGRVNQERGD